MSFDKDKYYLGRLCKYGHNFDNTGKSLRYKSSRQCVECSSSKSAFIPKPKSFETDVKNFQVQAKKNNIELYENFKLEAKKRVGSVKLAVVEAMRMWLAEEKNVVSCKKK